MAAKNRSAVYEGDFAYLGEIKSNLYLESRRETALKAAYSLAEKLFSGVRVLDPNL
jgi:hypothetical protein